MNFIWLVFLRTKGIVVDITIYTRNEYGIDIRNVYEINTFDAEYVLGIETAASMLNIPLYTTVIDIPKYNLANNMLSDLIG